MAGSQPLWVDLSHKPEYWVFPNMEQAFKVVRPCSSTWMQRGGSNIIWQSILEVEQSWVSVLSANRVSVDKPSQLPISVASSVSGWNKQCHGEEAVCHGISQAGSKPSHTAGVTLHSQYHIQLPCRSPAGKMEDIQLTVIVGGKRALRKCKRSKCVASSLVYMVNLLVKLFLRHLSGLNEWSKFWTGWVKVKCPTIGWAGRGRTEQCWDPRPISRAHGSLFSVGKEEDQNWKRRRGMSERTVLEGHTSQWTL